MNEDQREIEKELKKLTRSKIAGYAVPDVIQVRFLSIEAISAACYTRCTFVPFSTECPLL